MGTLEWGPGGGEMPVVVLRKEAVALNSRSSDASRSEGGSSSSKPGVVANAGDGGVEPGTEKKTKKKRRGKFLSKQFEILTKGALGGSPRVNRGVNLLGQNYIIPVPGSKAVTTTDAPEHHPDLKSEERNASEIREKSPPSYYVDQKPPIEFVTASIDYKAEAAQRREVVARREVETTNPPLDFITERSPRKISPRVTAAALSTRVYASMSRSHSSSIGRSPSGSDRLSSYSGAGTPRSERSVLSIPETVMSSAAPGVYSRAGSLKSESRSSSLAEWSSQSLDRRGELSIAGLSIGEGRNVSGMSMSMSRRTDLSIGLSPARSDAQLAYSPDDTDSGVEMYHETTSASPGSYSSRRPSCSLSEGWMPEVEDSDGASHQYRGGGGGGGRRDDAQSGSSRSATSYSSQSRSSQFRSARYSPPSMRRARSQYSPNTIHNLLESSSHTKMRRHSGDYYVDNSSYHQSNRGTRKMSSKRDVDVDAHQSSPALASSKVVVLLNKYGRKKGHVDDAPVALDSMTPEEAIAVFHDEVARMLLEEGQECGEAADVEEFLDGYMRLRSPFYVAMVDEFFRAVCVDCYRRPVEHHPVDGRSGSASSKSLRSDAPLHHRLHNLHSFGTRM